MSDPSKEERFPATDWVERLASYRVPNADPIYSLARHQTGDEIKNHPIDRKTGEVQWAPPSAWRETHQYSVPHGLRLIRDGRCEGFSEDVRDGRTLSLWLKRDAISRSIPTGPAQEQFEKRVDTMVSALKQRFNLPTLEARIYYPSEKISNATRERGHEVAACVLLAVPAARVSVLKDKIKPALEEALTQHERLKLKEEVCPPNEVSAQAVERMLAKHRDPKTHETRLEHPLFAVAEIGDGMAADAYCLDVRADGMFHLTYPIAPNITRTELLPARDFGPHGASSILVIPMRDDFSAVPPTTADAGDKNPETLPGVNEALEFDKLNSSACTKALCNEFGGQWNISRLYNGPMGNLIVLAVDHPEQKSTLDTSMRLLNEARHYRMNKRADWRDMFEVRGIDPSPPQR